MRIIGQIQEAKLLITVFKMTNKISVKIEIGPFEQWYKFLETDDISTFEDVKKIFTKDRIQDIFLVFNHMDLLYKKIHDKIT